MTAVFNLELPSSPGVYRFLNGKGELIYIGKAKNLRRRLAQYRNAKRCKAHAKMRKLKKEAKQILFEVCETELQALLLETRLIQTHRPKWNVAGAFFFLYPLIGIRKAGQEWHLCYTTEPEAFPDFRFFGAFRSRLLTREFYFALTDLLKFMGHPVPFKQILKNHVFGEKKRGLVFGFRQIPSEWQDQMEHFLRGESFEAIEELSILLLDRPSAVLRSKETEEKLHLIRSFYRQEVLPLKKAILRNNYPSYPVAQKERDVLFILDRSQPSSSTVASPNPT